MLNFFAQHTLIEGDFNLVEIRVQEEIGRGNSHVFTAYIKDELYALKQIEIKNDYEYQSFLKEISNMKELTKLSPHLIKYYGYFVTLLEINQYSKCKYAHIIMECAQMNLQTFLTERLNEGKRLTKNEIIKIIDFLLEAFENLEKNKVAHCDIKPENILLVSRKNLEMKLCDVGSCKAIDSETVYESTILGTVPFLAPELIKTKSGKVVSLNVFKSDVFSFGLVILYLITFKKFNSKERMEVSEQVYFEIISEWIKESREIINYDCRITEILRNSLEFSEHKRMLFSGVKNLYEAEKKRKKALHDQKIKKLEQSDNEKKAKLENEYFTSVPNIPTIKISLFKVKKTLTKISTRTTSIGFPKINKYRERNPDPRNYSPMSSPISAKRQSSCFTNNSPDKNNTIIDYKKIIYVTEEDKEIIPFQELQQDDKIFVLLTNGISIKSAECVSVYPTYPMMSLNELGQVEGNKLYLEYEKFDGISVDSNAPILKFRKIYANLRGSELLGGYKSLFKILTWSEVEILEVDLSESIVTFNEVSEFLDRLQGRSMKYIGLIWHNYEMSSEEHSSLIEKLAKINVKKLNLILNENYIKYEKESRWSVPKNLEVLYLEYVNNFLHNLIPNLSVALSGCELKELYLNLSHNNLSKSASNILFKSISSIETLEKLIINLSWNPLEDISYIMPELSKFKNLTSFELKIHHACISERQMLEAVSEVRGLFDQALKIFKISYDRTMTKDEFKEKITRCFQEFNGGLKIDVISYDTKYIMAFIKKTNKPLISIKTASHRIKGKTNLNGFKMADEDKEIKTKTGQCTSLYSTNYSFDNYVCLACSQLNELSKNSYYCKFCIENCQHKGHNIVKIYERVKCCCSYSGCCTTDLAKRICAEDLKINSKRVYKCFKCNQRQCESCISKCNEAHKEWVEETKDSIVFECGEPI